MSRPSIWDWATDEVFTSGGTGIEGAPTKIKPSAPQRGFAPGSGFAAQIVNHVLREKLDYLGGEVPVRNLQRRVAVTGLTALSQPLAGSYSQWVIGGEGGSFDVSQDGYSWTSDDNGDGFAIPALFRGVGDVSSYIFTFHAATPSLVRWWDGSTWDSHTLPTADDMPRAGVGLESTSRLCIIGTYGATGAADGQVLLLHADHDDLTTWGRTTFDTSMSSLVSYCIAASSERVLAMASSSTRIDAFTSTTGASWSQLEDVIDASAQLADLVWDARGDRWLLATAASGIWSAPAAGTPWSLLCAHPDVTAPGSLHRLRCIDGRLVVTMVDQFRILLSDNDGATWTDLRRNDGEILDLHYSSERRQLLVLDSVGAQQSRAI